MEPPSAEEKERELLGAIEEYLVGEGHFGIDPRVLLVLDNLDSSRKEIAAIEEMIEEMIAVRLRNMASSVYFGMHRRGKANTFNDVITTLGMWRAKILIIAMALFSRIGPEHARLEVESFAISFFARMIAEQMGFDQTAREKAELEGLFLNLGRVLIAIYQARSAAEIEPAFVERHHRQVASWIIAVFKLPDYLEHCIHQDRLVLQQRSFSIDGIVYLAQSLVQRILDQFGIIDIKGSMPDVRDNLEVTLASMLSEHFSMIGLGKYMRIRSD